MGGGGGGGYWLAKYPNLIKLFATLSSLPFSNAAVEPASVQSAQVSQDEP